MKRAWDRRWGGSWRRRARGAYIQVVFNGKCIGTLPNWRLVAGGVNRQVKLRAGSNVLIVKKFNSYIPGDKTLCPNALHKFGHFNLFCWNFRYSWLATHVSPFLLHLGGLSLLWTTPIIIRPQPNRGTKRTETGLYQNKKGTAPIAVYTGD